MSEIGRTALVTGGSRGIGKAIALELAGRFPRVAIFYAGREDAARETVEELEQKGVNALALKCDVSDERAVKEAVARVRETLGPVGALVSNAGITRDGLTLRMGGEDFARVVAVNLAGAFHVAQACYRDLLRGGWGRVVFVGSVSGLMGNPGQANYAASKAGLVGLTKTLARELAPRGVTVNLVAPGFIDTEMTRAMNPETLGKALQAVPAGRAGRAEEVAKAVGFLCSGDADYITGCVLQVDGGMYM
ncbi:MAG: 3-oxoacyl-[acyl-carrier-protein] reductase [Clostridiales bacterium]|nr:3-oxoacyl-[acyl-carrier-protein] reductase [Clostridiales bacterium]